MSIRSFALVALLASAQASAAPTGPLSTYLVEPCRLVDTRNQEPLQDHREQLYRAQGSCGVPVGAKAVLLNITATGATACGHLSAYDPAVAMALPPATSTLNFRRGHAVANAATVPLSEGSVSADLADFALFVVVADEGTVHVIVDVVGYLQ